MKKTYVLKNKGRFAIIMGLLTAILLVLIFAGRAYSYKAPEYRTVSLKQGDTLWELALKYNKEGDIRSYIYEVQQLNNMESSDIKAGEKLIIPIKN
ncbi:LysM domain-containing protein [Anaerobacterium chartisolvens]|uniref:LysM domain-containing protein n=1 Tax=Anaerobacterium chartisolvens TaxID=1297424 RepID=A0A369AMU0_9FIRM|nr:LysM peptidoglycan-binding domain-containing protein [Anaerobacterium chartisolvens]RCX10363.1 LysM domain-containing protein [Anaerobacterium chartisolvens]